MKKIINSVVLFVFIINMTGCATLLKEKETQVKVNSEPQGAEVYQTIGRMFRSDKRVRVGRTPVILTLENKHDAEFTFKKDGYEDYDYTDKSEIAHGWMLASLCCLVFPALIDFASKNARNLKDKEIKVTLDPVLPKQTEQINIKK